MVIVTKPYVRFGPRYFNVILTRLVCHRMVVCIILVTNDSTTTQIQKEPFNIITHNFRGILIAYVRI